MGGYSENGQGLIDHGTLESGVSDKWFDKLSRLIEWFVHADSDGRNNVWFDCQSAFYVWHLNAVRPWQLYLATFFHKNSLQAKTKKMIQSDPKTRFFHFLKNFAIYFCWKCPLIKIYAVIYLTVQIPNLGKFLLFSYNLKGFQPISLQDSLITNTSPVWMTGSHWFFACRQTVRTGKGFN